MKVVLSADGSDESAGALQWCLTHLDGSDRVIAVAGLDDVGEFVIGFPPFDSLHGVSELKAGMERDVCAPLAKKGIQCEARLVHHQLAKALAETARGDDVDAIVVGKHPRGVIGDVLHAEVADALLHDPPCAIVVVPVAKR
jgi:nucleotide-binding universal stress UspA family protein